MTEEKGVDSDSAGFGFEVPGFGSGFEMPGFAHHWSGQTIKCKVSRAICIIRLSFIFKIRHRMDECKEIGPEHDIRGKK